MIPDLGLNRPNMEFLREKFSHICMETSILIHGIGLAMLLETNDMTESLASLSGLAEKFDGRIRLRLLTTESTASIVKLTNNKKQIIRMMGWQMAAGNNIIELSGLESLPAGRYQLDVMDIRGEYLFEGAYEKMP